MLVLRASIVGDAGLVAIAWPPSDRVLLTEPTYNRTLRAALAWRARYLSQKARRTVSRFRRLRTCRKAACGLREARDKIGSARCLPRAPRAKFLRRSWTPLGTSSAASRVAWQK